MIWNIVWGCNRRISRNNVYRLSFDLLSIYIVIVCNFSVSTTMILTYLCCVVTWKRNWNLRRKCKQPRPPFSIITRGCARDRVHKHLESCLTWTWTVDDSRKYLVYLLRNNALPILLFFSSFAPSPSLPPRLPDRETKQSPRVHPQSLQAAECMPFFSTETRKEERRQRQRGSTR